MSEQPGKQTARPARRQPRFTAFLLTGGFLGLLGGLILSLIGPTDPGYGSSATLGFLGLIGAGLGVLTGGVIAVLFDRRTQPPPRP